MQDDTNQALAELGERLGVLINILAYQAVQGKSLAECAPVLRRLGLTLKEIAIIFDSTPKAVSVRVAEAKKKKRPGTRRK